MIIDISSVMSLLGEIGLTIYFFKNVPNKSVRKPSKLLLLAMALLLRTALYLSGIPLLSKEPLGSTGPFVWVLRTFLRFVSTTLYLVSCKKLNVKSIAFWAGFETELHDAVTSVRVCGFVIYKVTTLSGEPLYISVLVFLTECAVYVLIRRKILVINLMHVGITRIAQLLICFSLHLVIRWALRTPQYEIGANVIALAILADFGVTFSLIAFERNQQMRERQLRLAIEKMELKSEVTNAMRAQRADQNLKRLYHDMKNHLLAIQSMAGDKKELNDYLGELLPQLDDYGNRLNTGSAIIDALLGDKRERAMGFGVRLHVQLDLTPLSFMNNAELVSIFGNAVDNAVEAARECPDSDERCVYIKSRRVRDMFFLSFENHYAGERSRQAGRFMTGKADREFHGIGLGSIEKAVRKYSGEVHAEHDNEKRLFTLNIMLPLPEQSE